MDMICIPFIITNLWNSNSNVWNRNEEKELPALTNIILGDGFQRNGIHHSALNCYRDALKEAINHQVGCSSSIRLYYIVAMS